MDISIILKVAGTGILVSVAYMILSRSGREEMAMLVSLAGVIIILLMIVDRASGLFNTIRQTFGL
ncbi:MAG: stage III sporulation protein AC [Clostridia bacterium]|nr:stage III sporulation protein AC [Clostridia bacterium]